MVAVLCDDKERRIMRNFSNTAYDGLHASSSSFWKPLYAKYTPPTAEKDSAGFVDSKGKDETVRHRKLAYYGHTMRKHGTGVAWRKR